MPVRDVLLQLAAAANRRVGHLVSPRLRRRVRELLSPSAARESMMMYVDIIGSCNLRCPSCPVGNMGPVNPTGLMSLDLFTRIVQKASREFSVSCIGLYNWAEPILHPQLPDFIRVVKRAGLQCIVSSNLNQMRNIEEVLRAAPDVFRISLSGFSQETYGQTHAEGDIDRVKANMRILSETKHRLGGARPRVHVFFHKYRHNLAEVEPMRRLAVELGFEWEEAWAYYMPLERVLQLVDGSLPEPHREFVETKFALPIREAVDTARQFRSERCIMLEDQITLDVRGNVILCCTVYDYSKNTLGHFLDMSPEGMTKAKSRHPTCSRCMGHGLHVYSRYLDHPGLRPAYEELAKKNLSR